MRIIFTVQGFILLLIAAACGKKKEIVHAESKWMTSAVYASGTLVPASEYRLIPETEGYLKQAFVKEGDEVKAGQTLFLVTSSVRQEQEAGSQSILRETEPLTGAQSPLLKEISGQIELAALKKTDDSVNYQRHKRLLAADAVSRVSYEKSRLQYEVSVKDLQNLKQRRQQQYLSQQVQLQQAKNQLALARTQTGSGNLRSAIDGKVYDIYKKPGDFVAPGQPLALIGSRSMIAKLLIDEDDLAKVREGQKVLLSMDAFPGRTFEASISRIYPILSKAEQSFRADAILVEAIPHPIYGLNLEANIIITERKKVIVIPRRALIKDDRIVIRRDGEERAIPIQKGMEDENWVEVIRGLDTLTEVIIRP